MGYVDVFRWMWRWLSTTPPSVIVPPTIRRKVYLNRTQRATVSLNRTQRKNVTLGGD